MNYDEDFFEEFGFADCWDDDGNVYGYVYIDEDEEVRFKRYPREDEC